MSNTSQRVSCVLLNDIDSNTTRNLQKTKSISQVQSYYYRTRRNAASITSLRAPKPALETLNRALLSSFLAEFSDFEGMLGLYTCNTDSPLLLSCPSLATIATPISWLSPRSLSLRSRRGCPCRC